MATAVQFRRGNTSDHSTFTGLEGEITVDTDKNTVVVHDGSTAGGIPLAKASEVSSVATQITTADAGSDTTMFPLLTADATGNLAPKTDESGLTYNSTNGILTATIFSGNLSGGTADVTAVSTTDQTGLLFTNSTSNSIQIPDDKAVALSIADSGGTTHLTFNTSSNTIITARTVQLLGGGTFTGNSSTATTASNLVGSANITTVVNSTAQTASNFYGQRMIHTGGDVTYTFAETGSISGTDIGKSVVIVNAGTGDIDLDITTSKFFELVPSLNADYADSSSGGKTGADAHKLVKGGVAEFIVTETDKIIIMGSGIQ